MKRMIDNKDYEALKKEVEVIEGHTSDYVITEVVLDEDNNVLGSKVKDLENDVTYNLLLGSQVEANPTLEGTESDLEGIEIDGTKYKVGGGSQLYQHNIRIRYYKSDGNYNFVATFIKVSAKSTAFTDSEIQALCSTARNVIGGFHGINQAPQPITSVQYVPGTTNKWLFNYWTGATNTYQSFNEDNCTLSDDVEDTAYTA